MIRTVFFALAILAASPLRAEVDITEVKTPGGLKAWLLADHSIPFTALNIRFLGGTSLDEAANLGAGKRGAVNLMTALIEEGAGDLDAQGFAAARDGLAARFSFSSDADGISISAQFLTENRDAALALLADALTRPRFDQDALDRVRGQVLAGLANDAKDPSTIAAVRANAAIFGDHPYGSDDSGTAQSVAALTRADMQAAFAAAIAKDRVIIAAAGDISAQDLGVALDALLGGLPAKGAPLPPRATPNFGGDLIVQDFPNPQSVVRFSQAGIAVSDPDFLAASLVNEILGGGRFTSRLMTQLREVRGLTYGVRTGLASLQLAETFGGGFDASNDKVAEAVAVLQDEWAKMASGDITQAEFTAAQTYMIGAYPLRFDSNGAIAAILVGMQINGFGIDYPKTRNARVAALTLDDVQRAARRLLRPDALQITIVGQPAGLP
jgi:zinc protease